MSEDSRILIVDDEPDMVDNCARILRRAGYKCLTTSDPHRALTYLETDRPDVLLTDLKMPEMDGMELLRRARALDPALPVIVITAFATIESAVDAVKHGAFDYLPKNFSIDQLTVTVERALRQRRLQVDSRNLREQLQETRGLDNVIGRSPAMAQVFELVKKAARSEANILPVDCASLPEALLESELFGHEKGAFTGAVRTKAGLLETASGGTVFLDEIGELPMGLQSKLLRTLQERQVRRVGGTSLVDIDVRLVSATNRDVRGAVLKGDFREELLYRINVIAIVLPPLRERAGDVRLLAHAFLKRYGVGRVTAYDEEAMEALERYAWPGNVRELQNVVERACALADSETITRRDLPEHLLQGARLTEAAGAALPAGAGLGDTADLGLKEAKDKWMSVLEASYLKDLLARHGGNITAAAKTAGIDRKTFHRLLNKHGIK